MDKLIICAGIPGFSQRMARTAFITKLCQLRRRGKRQENVVGRASAPGWRSDDLTLSNGTPLWRVAHALGREGPSGAAYPLRFCFLQRVGRSGASCGVCRNLGVSALLCVKSFILLRFSRLPTEQFSLKPPFEPATSPFE